MRSLLVFAALLFAFPAHAEVTIDWVTVGDPGNACDTQSQGCFGAVAQTYRIAKYEVTAAEHHSKEAVMIASTGGGPEVDWVGSGAVSSHTRAISWKYCSFSPVSLRHLFRRSVSKGEASPLKTRMIRSSTAMLQSVVLLAL